VKKSTAPLVENMMKQADYKPYILVDAPTEVDVSQVVVAEGMMDAALPAAIVPITTGSSIPAAAVSSPATSVAAAASSFTPPPAAEEAVAPSDAVHAAAVAAVAPPPAIDEQPAPPTSARQLPQARALYDYEAQDYRQITIAVGDVVTILDGESPYEGVYVFVFVWRFMSFRCVCLFFLSLLDRLLSFAVSYCVSPDALLLFCSCLNTGWWMVTLDGNQGIAPSNYMERL
jgi:hypothetical protein